MPEDWVGHAADPTRPLDFAAAERAKGKQVYPPEPLTFSALERTPFDAVRVVILGQDPYHGPGQAEGLSFSVPPGTRTPPSLRNIFNEIGTDLGLPAPTQGHLGHWARQGVLLLNATLTVERGRAGSHRRQGWEGFTDSIIAALAASDRPLVFLLWGNDAQKKAGFVASPRHLTLAALHPSPLSAYAGFLGCRHFSKTNAFLTANGLAPIDWGLL